MELTQRAKEGKPLYGESDQPLWVRGAAHNNSVFSQLKMREYHPARNMPGTEIDPACRRLPLVSIKHVKSSTLR